jgi:hypothetical protein
MYSPVKPTETAKKKKKDKKKNLYFRNTTGN